MHLKLDELLRAVPKARKAFMDVEEEDLAEIAHEKEIVDQDDRALRMVSGGRPHTSQSLTIGALSAPDEFLIPLARGLLDGDGSVINDVYRADTARRPDYFWEYLITSFKSASRPHLEWLQSRLHATTGQTGYLSQLKLKSRCPIGTPSSSSVSGSEAHWCCCPCCIPPWRLA
jgi:hypothetical protein